MVEHRTHKAEVAGSIPAVGTKIKAEDADKWLAISTVTRYYKDMPMLRTVNKDFFKKWTREMAYVLGLFASDGYMWKNNRESHFFAFQITDGSLLEKVREALGSNHHMAIRQYKNKKWKTSYRIQIGSREMFNDLEALGMTQNKTKTLRYPAVPRSFFRDFVRGYFDGDGNVWVGEVHKERETRTRVILSVITSGSKGFLVDFSRCLQFYGFGKGSLFYRQKAWRLQYSVRDSILLYHLMYDSCSSDLFLDRKRKKFEEYLKMRV